MNDTKEQLYAKQAEIFSDQSVEHKRLAETWFDETTADYWLHNRMYEAVDCLKHQQSARWLTVGDGRWGLDAIRIKKRGFKEVLPTDICETLLEASKKRGLIESYSVENVEKLSFDDNSFDYVFCKESYHHFPRPYMALYEMLRVASKAVFLAEPNDEPRAQSVGAKEWLKFKLQVLLSKLGLGALPTHYRKPVLFATNGYEESGNYVYSISKREVQKLLQGLNYPQMAYKESNTHYIKGCEFEPADVNKSSIFKQIVDTINMQDERCAKGWEVPSLIMMGLFKESMDAETRCAFESQGWTVVDLPRNPYL
jgi:ubiquinone/menaquinone biosynthesis C-methylase UbiE